MTGERENLSRGAEIISLMLSTDRWSVHKVSYINICSKIKKSYKLFFYPLKVVFTYRDTLIYSGENHFHNYVKVYFVCIFWWDDQYGQYKDNAGLAFNIRF